MRRQEFEKTDIESADLVLREAKVGHLAYQRDGEIELLPYNFCWTGEHLYFHASPKTGLATAAGQKVKFLAYSHLAWIPSTWRHPNLACPATTYFCSLSNSAVLEPVESRAEKATALELFMQKYQGDESYKPLSDKVYHGPLDALFVGRMTVKNPVIKMKMGQHLSAKHRGTVFHKLRERAQPGDRQVAEVMALANPDLREENQEGREWVEALNPEQVKDLATQLSRTYWAHGRTTKVHHLQDQHSQVVIALVKGNQVLAYARASLVSPGTGYLADVIVRKSERGKGLGHELVRRISEHPRVKSLRSLMLVTRDQERLYEKFGFVEKYRSESTFMVRFQGFRTETPLDT